MNQKVELDYIKDLILYVETGEYRMGAHPFSTFAAKRNRLIYIIRGLSQLHYFDVSSFDYDTLHRDCIMKKLMYHHDTKDEAYLLKLYS